MTLDLFNDVFLLHFALETAKRIFEGLSLLQSDFRQLDTPPKLVPFGPDSYCKLPGASQELYTVPGDGARCRLIGAQSSLKKSVSKRVAPVAERKSSLALTGFLGTW